MEEEPRAAGQRFQRQRQEIGRQSNGLSKGTKFNTDHDSSFQTVGTLDDSCMSHAEHYRTGFHLKPQNKENQHQQNVLEQVYSSSLEREQEIVRLQKKMCKLQHKIGKLQKRVAQLQNL